MEYHIYKFPKHTIFLELRMNFCNLHKIIDQWKHVDMLTIFNLTFLFPRTK